MNGVAVAILTSASEVLGSITTFGRCLCYENECFRVSTHYTLILCTFISYVILINRSYHLLSGLIAMCAISRYIFTASVLCILYRPSKIACVFQHPLYIVQKACDKVIIMFPMIGNFCLSSGPGARTLGLTLTFSVNDSYMPEISPQFSQRCQTVFHTWRLSLIFYKCL